MPQEGDSPAVEYTDLETQLEDQDTQTNWEPTIQREDYDTSLDTNTIHDDSSPTVAENPAERNVGQELATHFSSWFFKLLHSLANCAPGTNSTEWGPQHFWQDAKLTVRCNEPSGMQETMVEGAEHVSTKFQSMVVVDKLCFNPNISDDSIKGRQDPHGLVIVMVCGTVHRQKQYLGVFEQSFGLVRDPTEENNWKIKFSKLLLKASGSGLSNWLEGPDNALEEPE